jgi:lipopolysaccharide transport system ATP-binding protein
VEDVGKLYRLGEIGTGTISHDLNRWWARVRGKDDPFAKIGETNDRTAKGESDYVWALKDVNFEIKQGEAIGIIGRNGAGKSTLLKLLSKVTTPTSGTIKIKGRIASLLEVGTGFHPELTGRENIFLNGAILGMTKKEIFSKFDEIVEFAGVERYIDTPVKRYSSGMYVRLAFAVAAHLESEILIIDEVLAVGDAEFQKKCLGKMDDASKHGRTVLFVSHQMGTIAQLCSTSILMNKGRTTHQGPTQSIIETYLKTQNNKGFYEAEIEEVKNKEAFFVYQKMVDEQGNLVNQLTNKDPIILEMKINVQHWHDDYELSLSLQHRIKGRIFTVNTPLKKLIKPGEEQKIIRFSIKPDFLVPNNYSWLNSIHIPGSRLIDVLWEESHFTLNDAGTDFARYEGVDYGVVILKPEDYQVNTL